MLAWRGVSKRKRAMKVAFSVVSQSKTEKKSCLPEYPLQEWRVGLLARISRWSSSWRLWKSFNS